MSIYFLWANDSVDPANISSCTSEAGLIVDVPVADTANNGTLRLRSSGNPYTDIAYDLELIGGGNPTGYSSVDNFFGSGASLLWREQADAADEWRGYIDSVYLVRVETPFLKTASGNFTPPSHPRELPDGTLGVLYSDTPTVWRFARYAEDGTFLFTDTAATAIDFYEHDFVILPSGRLVAFIQENDVINYVNSYYSDDNGATWTFLGKSQGMDGALPYMGCEYVPDTDMIVMVRSDDTGVQNTEIWVSRDGGVRFTLIESSAGQVSGDTCVTPDGVVLKSGTQISTNLVYVIPIAAGGGFGDSVATTAIANFNPKSGTSGIVTRDDGSIWAFGMNKDDDSISMSASVSIDGGLTWADPLNSMMVWDTDVNTGGGVFDGYDSIRFGTWNGKIVCVAGTRNPIAGTDRNIHLLTIGGWDSLADVKRDLVTTLDGLPYEHVYLPVAYPDALGWTLANVGVGATITNTSPGALKIVATAAANSGYTSSAAFWTGSTGDTRRIRFRCKVNSGGSIADDRSRLKFGLNDGVNDQEVILRFNTFRVSVLDGVGNVLITKAVDMTDWVEFIIAFAHDSPAGQGLVSIWRRQIDETFWTVVLASGVVAEQAGTNNDIRFGGSVAGAVDWEITFLGVADDDNGMSGGFTNPTDLPARPLSATSDYRLSNGVNVGGYNGAGVPSDGYTLGTTYSYGKENIWREFRPSRELRSEVANAQWDIIFDSGADKLFHANTLALVGTNFRDCNWRMHTDTTFPAGSVVNLDLNATLVTGPGGTSFPGGFIPSANPGWRKDQFKSSAARKWYFSDAAGTRFLITGNEGDRIYFTGLCVNGAWALFGDRMGKTHTEARTQYARLRVGAQLTAEGYYRLGTLITSIRKQLASPYSHDFVDRIQANVQVHESVAGYRSGSVLGPRRTTLAIQWTPINALQSQWADQMADFYNAVNSSTTPFVFWRDSSDQTTIQMVRVVGTYARPNQRGELRNAVAGIDQLVLEEEL